MIRKVNSMFYKNVSMSVKTFHGVTFQPGETKEVDKTISNKWMILTENKPKVTTSQQKLSSEKLKKDTPKKEDTKPTEQLKQPEGTDQSKEAPKQDPVKTDQPKQEPPKEEPKQEPKKA